MNLVNNDGSTRDRDRDRDRDAALMKMEVASVTYQFKVEYAKSKNIIPDGDFITSPIFKMNDHDCKIRYFPPGSKEVIGLTLAINSKSVIVTASFTFGLLDKYGCPSTNACKSVAMNKFYPFSWDYCDIPHFMKQSELEAHYVRDGCFTLVCTIRILNNSYKEMPKRFVNGIMPFSIDEHFLQLLNYGKESTDADVKFEVEGEIFTAHRLVLVTRSRVFKGMFFGQMAESKAKTITIKGMKPAVFKVMLHFIYTDSLPDMSHENIPILTMTRHLLVAAYRYGLDGLMMLCEDSLVRSLSVDTVIRTLALANDLGLDDLEDRCIRFVCEEENLLKLSVTDEYLQLMVRRPLLFQEIKCLASFLYS